MIAIPSGNFLKEFTLIADKASNDNEIFIIQRPNDKNLVLMSLDNFNDIQRKIFLSTNTAENK